MHTKLRHTCRGTATSAAINAAIPRNELFVAAAVEDRPTFASTIYANVLEYIHLYKVKRQRKWG